VPQMFVLVVCAVPNMDGADQLPLIVELAALVDLALEEVATDCQILPPGIALLLIPPLEAASLDPAAHILVILDLESQRLTQPYSELVVLAPTKDLHAAAVTALLDPPVLEPLI